MAKKINQQAMRAAIKKMNAGKLKPGQKDHDCSGGMVGKQKCIRCYPR